MKLLKIASIALAGLLMSGTSFAHTIAVGTINAGAPGSVTIWLGSYHHNAPNEGSMTLNGSTQAFNLLQFSKPGGLTDGDNYFYANAGCCTGTAGNFVHATNGTGQTEVSWQGVTFTGLTAGTYTYSITGMNTVNWADWNSNTSNWTGTLVIPGSSVGVPAPGVLALMGLGLAAFGFSRRRRETDLVAQPA